MKCEKCGMVCKDTQKFCLNCGNPLHPEEPENIQEQLANSVGELLDGFDDDDDDDEDDFRVELDESMFEDEAVKVQKELQVENIYSRERAEEESEWEYDEDNEIPMNQDTVQSTADAIRQMEAVRELENPDQLSDYGLDKPSYTIQFQDNDGVTTEILIGNGAGENYYATVGDSGKVYTISSDFQNYLQFDLTNLVQYDTVPAFMQAQQKLPPRLWRAHRDV